MDSAVQPILCCLGQSVGECPTQYLMELAFADQHLDWRAITVDVKQEDLAAAIDGARAMGLRGLRLWGDTQNFAVESLGHTGLPVSSALLTESGWEAWHTDGYVLANLVRDGISAGGSSAHGKPISFVLFGDTPQTRRIYGGLLNKYSLPPRTQHDVRVSWVGVTADVFPDESRLQTFATDEELLTAIRSSSLPQPTCFVGCSLHTAELLAAKFCALSGRDELDLNEPNLDASDVEERDAKSGDAITVGSVGESEQSSCSPSSSPALVRTGHVWWLPSPEESLVGPSESEGSSLLRCIRPADLLLHGEHYDFTRWTGQSIPLSMFRDAYDEFNAF